MEVGNSRGASQPDVAIGGAVQTAQQKLVEEILQLGRMPEHTRNPSRVEEKRLAGRLSWARRAGALTREQEAALDNLAQASGAVPAVTSGGAAPPAQQELVDEIIQLGRMSEQTRTPSRVEEKKLARVKAQELLQQVRDLGRYPKEKRRG